MNTRSVLQGGTLVLVLLVVLGVLSFGALGMMSAHADLKLARSAAAHIDEYYQLEQVASRQLHAVCTGGALPDGWVRQGDRVSGDVTQGGQNLHIELKETPSGYEITAWRQWQDDFEYDSGGMDIWIG